MRSTTPALKANANLPSGDNDGTNLSQVKARFNRQISKPIRKNWSTVEVRQKLNTRRNDGLTINDLMSERASDTRYAPDRHNSRGLVGDVPGCSASRALGRTLGRRQRHKFLSSSSQRGQEWTCDVACCRFVFRPRGFHVDAWFPTCRGDPNAFYRRGSWVSAEWPRGLMILITFFTVLTMFVWGALENNRNPNSESLRRVTIYFVVFYVFFLAVIPFFSD
jgi:hypothetical protein